MSRPRSSLSLSRMSRGVPLVSPDLSRNRFGEVPEAACRLVSLEGLSLYHNCLRSIPPAIANLQALAHLDLRYCPTPTRGILEGLHQPP